MATTLNERSARPSTTTAKRKQRGRSIPHAQQPTGAQRDAANANANGTARATMRRAAIPSTRALVGGLLVALSAVGLFVAAKVATTPTHTTWVIARRAIPVGATITKDDLAVAPAQLPDEVTASMFTDWTRVVGTVAMTPIDRNQLVVNAMLGSAAEVTGTSRRVSVEIPTAAALGGSIAPGQRVDIVAIGDNKTAATIVATDAQITALAYPSGQAIGTIEDAPSQAFGDRVIVTLIVDDADTATKLLTANENGGISLIAPATSG